MSHTITLELPENLYAALSKAAQESGATPSEWIVTYLNKHLASLDQPRSGPDSSGDNDEQRKARQGFRGHFGEVNSGDPRSADNDRIDADLAKAYADSALKDT
jgi:hypothetical protein